MVESEKTIWQSMPWLKRLLDYTDEVCMSVTEENGALRPADPQGGYFFSVKELLLHIVDSRWQFLGWLEGGDSIQRYAAEKYLQEYGGTSAPWQFKEATVAEAQARLAEVRSRLEAWLAGQPVSLLPEITESLQVVHQLFMERMRKLGRDTTDFEAGGPSNVADVLVQMSGHEQAHRVSIQAILRQHGYDVHRAA
jgi:uncharacterized damage-inducible protein DinB